MNKKIMTLLLMSVFFMTFSVTSCKKDDDDSNPLMGTWQNKGELTETTLTFKGGGKYESSMKLSGQDQPMQTTGTYTLDGDKLTMKDDIFKTETVYTYVIEEDNLTLTDKDGDNTVYTRK